MSANSSIVLSNLDFDTLKNTLKGYLKTQDKFKDYDFEGSNISVLLDLLSYNTYHNSFYLNMVGNEMFIDSAVLRDSVVSHAKELNYVPRSFKSAEAVIDLTVTTNQISKGSILIPKGTTFTSSFFNRTFTFSIDENIILKDQRLVNNQAIFTGSNIKLYEGIYVTDTYVYTTNQSQRFIISNKNVDISSLSVTVLEDSGAVSKVYKRALSLFDLDSSSQVYFVQAAEGDSYEVVFGDGVSGRKPKNNSVVLIEYRISNGELPNGCNAFTPDTTIDGEPNITVFTVDQARGGSVSESIESIRFNAPRYFTAQERAITAEDYESLLTINFPEINAVTAFGGEDLNPPQYGKVFIAVDLIDVDGLPEIKKQDYFKFIRPRSPVSIEPVFIDPEYTYLSINSIIKYNVNTTRLTSDDVKTIVTSAILDYAENNLNNFNKTFRYSQLVNIIDTSQASVISNDTDFKLIKLITAPELDKFLTFDIDFNVPLRVVYDQVLSNFCVTSTEFIYKGLSAVIRDDGNGTLFAVSSNTETFIEEIGSIDYETGLLQFADFKIDSLLTTNIKVYVTPKDRDVTTLNNVILNILDEDISIAVEQVRA